MSNTLNWIIFFGLILLLPTAYAGVIGAPYAPTFMAAIKRVFSHISLGPSDVIVDLGAGDGRVLLEAASRGAKAIGYELSPIMWFIVWFRLQLLNLSSSSRKGSGQTPTTKNHQKIYLRNFYRQKLPIETTVIFAFLMPEHMVKVKSFLSKQHLPNLRYVLIYAFPFPDLKPLEVIHEPKCSRLYVYSPSDFRLNT
jgi:hypothetical protein